MTTDKKIVWYVLVDHELRTVFIGDDFTNPIPDGAQPYQTYDEAEQAANDFAAMLQYEVNADETIPF